MDIKELKTKSERVYPEIVINAPNPAEAAVLQSDYAGKGSETTAIMTYIYQNYITRLYNEDVAEVLERIAITEMHHHDILGTTIARLGGNPVIERTIVGGREPTSTTPSISKKCFWTT